jgi:hypothetical protein
MMVGSNKPTVFWVKMKNHAYRLFGKSESLLLTSMLFAIILCVNAQQPPPISSNNNSDTQLSN